MQYPCSKLTLFTEQLSREEYMLPSFISYLRAVLVDTWLFQNIQLSVLWRGSAIKINVCCFLMFSVHVTFLGCILWIVDSRMRSMWFLSHHTPNHNHLPGRSFPEHITLRKPPEFRRLRVTCHRFPTSYSWRSACAIDYLRSYSHFPYRHVQSTTWHALMGTPRHRQIQAHEASRCFISMSHRRNNTSRVTSQVE